MNVDPWPLIAVFGALQGLVLAAVFATKRTNRTAHRLLAALLVAFAAFLAASAYYGAALVARWPHLFGVSHPVAFTFGPLTYLYALSASDRSRRLRRADAWHALLPGLILLSILPILGLPAAAKVAMFDAIRRGDLPWQVAVAQPVLLVSGILYAVLTLRFVARHERRIADSYSSLEEVNLHWLRWLAVASGGLWLAAAGFDALDRAGLRLPLAGEHAITLLMTALIYGIGYKGLRQPEIFQFATSEFPVQATPSPAVEPEAPSTSRYERSGLTERQAAALKQRLLDLMDREHPYRETELTLADLAGRLGTTPHKLSEVLNSQLEMSFYDFVNGYRVREVQRRLAGADGARLTYLALALEAGFASKSTFNAVFKKHTGQTPSAYRASLAVAEGAGSTLR